MIIRKLSCAAGIIALDLQLALVQIPDPLATVATDQALSSALLATQPNDAPLFQHLSVGNKHHCNGQVQRQQKDGQITATKEARCA